MTKNPVAKELRTPKFRSKVVKNKKKYDDGTFDTQNVNTHQLNSYHLTMKNKAETLTQGSSQPEVFNVLGQLQSIERIKEDHAKIEATKKPILPGLTSKE